MCPHRIFFRIYFLNTFVIVASLVLVLSINAFAQQSKSIFIPASDNNIQYTGRIDFSDPARPKFWAPGVYIKAMYEGQTITMLVNDENGGNNYLESSSIMKNLYAFKQQIKQMKLLSGKS